MYDTMTFVTEGIRSNRYGNGNITLKNNSDSIEATYKNGIVSSGEFRIAASKNKNAQLEIPISKNDSISKVILELSYKDLKRGKALIEFYQNKNSIYTYEIKEENENLEIELPNEKQLPYTKIIITISNSKGKNVPRIAIKSIKIEKKVEKENKPEVHEQPQNDQGNSDQAGNEDDKKLPPVSSPSDSADNGMKKEEVPGKEGETSGSQDSSSPSLNDKKEEDQGNHNGTEGDVETPNSENKEEIFTVTFVTNGGAFNKENLEVKKGEKVSISEQPTKLGHTFVGWFKDEQLNEKFDFNTETVTSSISLYAKWQINSYKVIFELNDGILENNEPKNVNHGQAVEQPKINPTKEGHDFEGWFKDNLLTTPFDFEKEKITEPTTIYAKWAKRTYTVTFVLDDETSFEGEKQVKVNHNEMLQKPNNPTKDGYTFVNWYEEQEFSTVFDFSNKPITQDISIYPKFEKNLIHVEATNTSESDLYSPLVLSFGDTVQVSRDESKDNIEDETVLNSIKGKIQGKTLDYIKYEGNSLKVYFKPDNSPKNGEKIIVLSGLPLYQYNNGKYVLVGETTNQLDLVFIDTKFKNIVKGLKTHTLQYKVSSSNQFPNYAYMAENAQVTSFEVNDNVITATYTFNQEQESTLRIYNIKDEDKKNKLLNSDENVELVLLYEYKLDLYKTQTYPDNKKVYTLQSLENLKVDISEEKQNVLVVFATNQNLNGQMPRLHYWGFEENSGNWENRPSLNKISINSKDIYYYLISSNKQADNLGFIITRETDSKFTGNIETNNEKIKDYFGNIENGKLKVILVTSNNDYNDKQNLDGVELYTGDNYKGFLEYIKQ